MSILLKNFRNLFLLSIINFIFLLAQVSAQNNGQVIKIDGVDNLLASILKTIQFYFPFVIAVVIALLGFKIATSGDDSSAKAEAKRNLLAVAFGSILIYGATFIATTLTGIVK